uniref:uncharacterized protein LOC104266793 n=1 Tax=Ciona intestinalis TaxID=7719 RepID=UPI00089DD2A4|nr:uncharacterized protein LOC104266793 [Ciona intestinalis]|eukprot:XP_018666789.1 uncharacterized protein LOC104266793 [Ciona intestinalis]
MHLDDEDVAKLFAEEFAEESWKVERYDEARKMFMQLIETPEQTSRFAALLLKLSFCCIVAGDVGEGESYFQRGVKILRGGPQCEPKCAEDLALVAKRFAEQKWVKCSLFLMQIFVGLIKGIQKVEQQLDPSKKAAIGLLNLITIYKYDDANQLVDKKYYYDDANQLVEDLISCSRRGQEAPDDQNLVQWMLVMLMCINVFRMIGKFSSCLKYSEEAETAIVRLNDVDEKTFMKVMLLYSRFMISRESKKFVEAKHFFSEMESMLPKIHEITGTELKEESLQMFEQAKQLISQF